MIAFAHLSPAEQEMAVYHHAKLYVAALNRGSVSFFGEPPAEPSKRFDAVLAIARDDAEGCEYTEHERRTILSPRSPENAR